MYNFEKEQSCNEVAVNVGHHIDFYIKILTTGICCMFIFKNEKLKLLVASCKGSMLCFSYFTQKSPYAANNKS